MAWETIRRQSRIKHLFMAFLAMLLVLPVVLPLFAADLPSEEIPAEAETPYETNEYVNVTVMSAGAPAVTCATARVRVEEMLIGLGFEAPDALTVNYPLSETVFEGMTLIVGTVTTCAYEETVSVPFATDYIKVQDIPRGTTNLVSAGREGTARVVRQATYIDGVLWEDVKVSSTVLEEPVNEVRTFGVGGVVTAEDGTEYTYSYYVDVVATAYKVGGITATGKEAKEGIIAVDPRLIPYGTKMFITGPYREIGYCSAEDCGPGIKGHRIDVCMEGTHQELLEFGRRNMRVYILE